MRRLTGFADPSGLLLAQRAPGSSSSKVHSTYSISVDGTSYIISGSNVAGLNANFDATISVWIKLSTSVNDFSTIAAFVNAGATEGFAIFGMTTMAIAAGFYAGRRVQSANNVLTGGAWTHLAITKTAGGISTANTLIYVNGALLGSTTLFGSGTPNFASGKAYVDNDSASEHGPAMLADDFRIYNVALSPVDVASLAAGNNVVAGLAAYWPFEEGSGNTTADTVGGNTATLTSGPTWSTDIAAALV